MKTKGGRKLLSRRRKKGRKNNRVMGIKILSLSKNEDFKKFYLVEK